MKTLYDILGVADTAAADVIKAAYKHLVLEHHPDRHFGDKAREAALKQVQEAYNVLRDSEKRTAYDGQLRAYRTTAAIEAANALALQERKAAAMRARAHAVRAGGAIAVGAAGVGLGILLVSLLSGDQGKRDAATGRFRGDDGRFRSG